MACYQQIRTEHSQRNNAASAVKSTGSTSCKVRLYCTELLPEIQTSFHCSAQTYFFPLFRSKEKHPPSASCGQRVFTNTVPPLVYPYTHAYRSHAVPSHSLRVIGRIPASPTALVGSGGGSEAYSQSAPLFLSPNGSSLYRRRLCYSSSSSLMGATIPHSAALCQLSCTSKKCKKDKKLLFFCSQKRHPFRFSYRLCNTFCIWSLIIKKPPAPS